MLVGSWTLLIGYFYVIISWIIYGFIKIYNFFRTKNKQFQIKDRSFSVWNADISMKLPPSRNFFLWIALAFIAISALGLEHLPLVLLKLLFLTGYVAMFLHVFPSSQRLLEKLLNRLVILLNKVG